MYEYLFFNSFFNKNNLLKFYLLKNSNLFFFNIFEYYVVETLNDFDVFSAKRIIIVMFDYLQFLLS